MNKTIITLLVLALSLVIGPCYADTTVTDGNGLVMTISTTGQVTGLTYNGTSVLNTSTFSGFVLQDANSGGAMNLTGSITTGTNSVTITGQTTNGLKLIATITSATGNIAIHTKVQDLNLTERAVGVTFALHLKTGTWNWHEDINTSYTDGAFHFQSNFPFAAISDSSNRGLVLGWPMSNPRNFGLYITPAANSSLEASVGLGLSSYTTKFPNYAEYDFILYSFDGADKFRGALSKYYAIYPTSFVSRASKQGLWALWVGSVEDYATRMGVAYNEAEFDFGGWTTVQRDNTYGFLSMQYSEPWGSYYPLPIGFNTAHPGSYTVQSPQFGEIALDKAALLAQVSSDYGDPRTADRYPGSTRDKVAHAIVNSAVELDAAGNWLMYHYSPKGFVWGSGYRIGWDNVQFILNPDPELTHPNRADIEWDGQIMYVQNKAQALVPSASLGGIYIDSCVNGTGWDRLNFRRAHWAFADYPLTYTQVGTTYVPAQALNLCFAEHFKWLRDTKAAPYNWPTLANSWQPMWPFIAAYVDILGVGEHNAVEPVGQDSLGNARAFAYHKPASVMDYALSLSGYAVDPALVQTMVEPKINHYLLYGIYPGTANSFYDGDDRILKLQLVAPVFEQYKPIFMSINAAGWEPVRAATISDSSLYLEQWGNNPLTGLYYTIHNPNADSRTVTVTISRTKITGGMPSTARELVTAQDLATTNTSSTSSFTITIAAKRTAAVRLLTPPATPIGTAKTNADGVEVSLDMVSVTGAFSGYLYVGSDDRSCGIRVVKASHGRQIGQKLSIVGKMATNADGERYISNPDIRFVGGGLIPPVGISGKYLGGGTAVTQQGVDSGVGLNNIGMLVTVWGKYLRYIDDYTFEIDDGSGKVVRCLVPSGVSINHRNASSVTVTGICSRQIINGKAQPVILIRKVDDFI